MDHFLRNVELLKALKSTDLQQKITLGTTPSGLPFIGTAKEPVKPFTTSLTSPGIYTTKASSLPLPTTLPLALPLLSTPHPSLGFIPSAQVVNAAYMNTLYSQMLATSLLQPQTKPEAQVSSKEPLSGRKRKLSKNESGKSPKRRKRRTCHKEGCTKLAQGRSTFCFAHGGGYRCQHPGCSSGARGCTSFCIKHGGGLRCSFPGCRSSARGKERLCISHGGGKRCAHEGCGKAAQGATSFCKRHIKCYLNKE